jgi:MFS family permease
MTDKAKLDRNVIITGITSFFTDISSEMIYPMIQAFVSMVMTTQKAMLGPILGIIEGIAESTASLLKLYSGYYSDKIEKRKTPTVAGYAVSSISKILLLAGTYGWGFILFSRFMDKVGKGIRTAPRDALISESTPKEFQGKAFGFQRGMDFAGAVIGSVILYFLTLHYIDPITKNLKSINDFYTIFLISLVPAFIAVAVLFFIKEPAAPKTEKKDKPKPNLKLRSYNKNLQVFFIAQFIFTLGNSSNQFLLLRSMELGYALSTVILMYIVFNITTTVLSTPFGILSDKIGRKKLLISGYALYAVVYLSFGFITSDTSLALWIFWPVYGVYYAMTEGVEKAFVADLAPAGSKATALGFYHTITGIGLLPASIIAGILFSYLPGLPFMFGGAMSVLAVIILGIGVRKSSEVK